MWLTVGSAAALLSRDVVTANQRRPTLVAADMGVTVAAVAGVADMAMIEAAAVVANVAAATTRLTTVQK